MDVMLPRLGQRLGLTRGVSILMYHGVAADPLPFHNWCFVTADAFRRQMAYLKRHFDVIPLADARKPRPSRRPAAIITFDDGYQNNFDMALPVLREFGLPATVFLTTSLINSNDTVWDGRLYLALCQTDRTGVEWNGTRYEWKSPAEKAKAFRSVKRILKQHPREQLHLHVREIVKRLNQDPDQRVPNHSPVRMLDSESISTMVQSGIIDFGAHTHNHCILSRLPPPAKREEIETSITETARLTGTPCTLFAYPNGTCDDYDAACVHLLEEAGIRIAVTTIEAPNHARTPDLELHRYGIGSGLSLARFQLKVHHLEHALKRWKK